MKSAVPAVNDNKIDIRPGVSVLAVLRHLNYKPWFAFSEFVDNSIQSYLKHRDEIHKAFGENFKLRVDIDIDPTPPARISIKDNAAGIFIEEFPRAFRPASPPPDRTGLAEFGMGMKSAACWFAHNWSVRTSALNDPVVRSVEFDIKNIIEDDIHELAIGEESAPANHHFTEIILDGVFQVPQRRTLGKLKEHLSDIYRGFIRDGILELRLNGEILEYKEPVVLKAPYYKDKDGDIQTWKKEIAFDLGGGLSVKGFVAIRETGNAAKAGFSLFRRGRVIQGSGDEGYKPDHIFGSPNSFKYQRLFGELHLDGFEVSHTKDGFRWDENEQPFLELLRDHIDSDELPILKQAENHRAKATLANLIQAAQTAVSNAAQAMKDHLPDILPSVLDAPTVETPTEEPPKQESLANKSFELNFRGRPWLINIEITNDPAESQWLVLSDTGDNSNTKRKIDIRLSMAHSFMERFAHENSEDMEALLRIAAAIALAEVLARDAGVRMAGTVRRNINEILHDALSQP